MKLSVALSLEEIAEGVEKTLKVKKHIKCDSCNGTGAETESDFETCPKCNGVGEIRQVSRTMFGQFVNVQPCPECNGEGRIIRNKCSACNGQGRTKGEETVKVKVPAGVREGNYITLRNQGNAGLRGGEPGDLIVLIEEKEHENFQRDGDDIYYDLVLSIPEATLGCEKKVPPLKGKAKIKVDAGTQPGKLLRMKDRVLRSLNSSQIGDPYFRVNVYIPKDLSDEEKEKIKSLKGADHFDPVNRDHSKKGFFSKIKDVFAG
jgi:molecular chaperone DnaJ